MKDWLGNEYEPGDKIVYAAMSGRSVTMILAEVVSINDRYYDDDKYKWKPVTADTPEAAKRKTTVTVQPINSARWTQHHPNVYHVDTRTGDRVDRWLHVVSGGYYVWADTGERMTDEERRNNYGQRYRPTRYERVVFADYIKEESEPIKPVTLTVTENITRWFGPVPTASVSLLQEFLHLAMNGECAPGGNETWQDLFTKVELYLRNLLTEPSENA